jgi:hypothetical protein
MEKFKPHPIDRAQVDRFLAGAAKKIESARKILAFDEEASLQQAYEAMLKASIGFIFSHGLRALRAARDLVEVVSADIAARREKPEQS